MFFPLNTVLQETVHFLLSCNTFQTPETSLTDSVGHKCGQLLSNTTGVRDDVQNKTEYEKYEQTFYYLCQYVYLFRINCFII